jgi:acyl carrier protein
MTDLEDFAALVRDEIGIPVTVHDLDRGFDELKGWDSVHLLSLVTALERASGRAVGLPEVLEAASLRGIYELYGTAAAR